MEYLKHPDNPIVFANRLMNSGDNHFYVSEDVRSRYVNYFGLRKGISQVSTQPPSLFADNISHQERCPSFEREQYKPNLPCGIAPFQYILFNSNVEYRKNLCFLIHAYALSRLPDIGISLVVCGGLQRDSYSVRAKSLGYVLEKRKSPGKVVFTDFVDNNAKDNLFLHASAITSPSLIEGFGIPVLDGACLGVPVLASDIGAHRDINRLYDFKNYVHLIPLESVPAWIYALDSLGQNTEPLRTNSNYHDGANILMAETRLGRYSDLSAMIWNKFKLDIEASIGAA
jgi:glycosyltransferase involved in cell wall biosynthesis